MWRSFTRCCGALAALFAATRRRTISKRITRCFKMYPAGVCPNWTSWNLTEYHGLVRMVSYLPRGWKLAQMCCLFFCLGCHIGSHLCDKNLMIKRKQLKTSAIWLSPKCSLTWGRLNPQFKAIRIFQNLRQVAKLQITEKGVQVVTTKGQMVCPEKPDFDKVVAQICFDFQTTIQLVSFHVISEYDIIWYFTFWRLLMNIWLACNVWKAAQRCRLLPQVLAVHADDASGILARSTGLTSQDTALCKEPTICFRYFEHPLAFPQYPQSTWQGNFRVFEDISWHFMLKLFLIDQSHRVFELEILWVALPAIQGHDWQVQIFIQWRLHSHRSSDVSVLAGLQSSVDDCLSCAWLSGRCGISRIKSCKHHDSNFRNKEHTVAWQPMIMYFIQHQKHAKNVGIAQDLLEVPTFSKHLFQFRRSNVLVLL